MEDDLDLLNQEISGIYFWELVRFMVHRKILQNSGIIVEGHSFSKRNIKKYLNITSNSVINIFYKNPFLTKKGDILFIGHPRRKKMDDGYFWDIFCDPVIEYLEDSYKCVLIETPYLDAHSFPPKTKNIKYADSIRLIIQISKLFNKIFIRFPVEKKELISKIENNILKIFNVKIDIQKVIVNKLASRRASLLIYSLLLKKIKPKLVIVIISYANEYFIEACKQLKIPIVELQHGAGLSWHHLGYSYPKTQKRLFPDYLFVYGDFWKSRVIYPINSNRVISVGYPFFEIEKANYKNEQISQQVVFISQGNVGKKISKFAVKLMNSIDVDTKIVYKLHPGEYSRWKHEYPWLINSGITVIDDDSIPLYKILSQSRFLIGVSSTVIYEGLGLGIKTFLLNLPGIEYMDELVESEQVKVISNVNEFIKYTDGHNDISKQEHTFFKPDSLKNIDFELQKIISNPSN